MSESVLRWLRQVRWLAWKNALVRRHSGRNALSTLAELLLPVLVVYILVQLHAAVPSSSTAASLHASDALSSDYDSTVRLLTYFPFSDGNASSANQQKIVFLSSSPTSAPSPALSSLVAAFAAAYPPLAASLLSQLPDGSSSVDEYVRSDQYGRDASHPYLLAAVEVAQFGSADNAFQWRYSLRLNASRGWSGGGTIDTRATPTIGPWHEDDYTYQLYMRGSQLFFQQFVDSYILSASPPSPLSPPSLLPPPVSPNLTAVPMPTPSYSSEPFTAVIGPFIGIMLIVVFNWNAILMVKALVQDKEMRFREQMRIMGVGDAALIASWLLTYAVLFAITASLVTALGSSTVFGGSTVGVWSLYFMFQLSMFGYCLLVAAAFDKAQTAAMVGSILFLAIALPYYAVDQTSLSQQTLGCLSAPICFSQAIAALVVGSAGGSQPSFTIGRALAMLLLDCLFYAALAWYIDQVVPTEYGTQRPWHFPFHRSYWLPRPAAASLPANDLHERFLADSRELYEEPSEALLGSPALRLRGLTKRYPRSGAGLKAEADKVAVDCLTMDMFDGQIFGLLGVNGAGKTTTINILTGNTPATSGDATVLGFDVHSEMGHIRQLIGLCQQTNVLYDRLTVRQHLTLFARVKGLDAAATASAVARMVDDAEMGSFVDQYVDSLSGGQKRKVSVCIALLGDSRVVFLDEPTAGMDPASRRSTWALLERAKAGRLIILTTHSMSEADRLCDRIGIMAAGKLRCCGSSLFLKRRLGAGYSLDVLHEPSESSQQAILDAVYQHIPDTELVSRAPMELAMKVRFERAPAFPALLEELDAQRLELHITSVSMQATTLEEIFLKVVQTAADEAGKDADEEEKRDSDVQQPAVLLDAEGLDEEESPSLSQVQLFLLQLRALLAKRYVHSRRSPRMWRLAVAAPVFLTVVGMLIRTSSRADSPAKPLSAVVDYSPVLLPLYNATSNHSLPAELWTSLGVTQPIALSNADLALPASSSVLNDATIAGMASWLWSSVTERGQGPFYGAFAYGESRGGVPQLLVWFNTSAPFALPSFVSLFDSAVLRQRTGVMNASIEASVQPFPTTLQEQSLVNAFTTPIFLSIALSMVSAFFAFYAVYERKCGIAHLQTISGLYPAAYWLGHWLFDFLTFLLSAACVLLVLAAFGSPDLLGPEAAPVTLLTLLLYGLAVVPAAYVFSLPFKDPVFAQGILTFLCAVSSGYLVSISLVLDLIPSTRHTNATLKFFYRLLPPFCLGEVITALSSRTVIVIYGTVRPIWSFELIGWPLLYLALDILLFSSLLALNAHWWRIRQRLSSHWPSGSAVAVGADEQRVIVGVAEADPEVAGERARLFSSSGPLQGEQVTVRGLRHVYAASGKKLHPTVALDDVYLSVRNSECLGLLGVNGAGKTTLLKILTNELSPTSGSIRLAGLDPVVDPYAVYRRTAYCPQFDALLEELTGRDHLLLFARLRGYHGERLRAVVARLVSSLDLQTGIVDRPVKEYSGGNKRKLCVGLAIIGEPRIVFLDEPSTGVDPYSRRLMWTLIASSMHGRSVILTSHLMEEVSALCQRIAILSKGRLQCLGSAQQLIDRYGDGFELHIAVRSSAVKAELVAEIGRSLPSAVCPQLDDATMKWQVPAASHFADGRQVSPGRLFGWAEEMKRQVADRDTLEYVVKDQTLEQVFLRLAARDGALDGDE